MVNFDKLITNKPERSFYHEIKESLESCDGYDLSVAFITFSGLQTIVNQLYELGNKGIKGRIITTNYMFGTDPKALEKLLDIPNLEVRVYDSLNGAGGFHTKGYIFKNNGMFKVIVGSSNLTTSALKTNKEWNISLKGEKQLENINNEYNYLWDLSTPLDKEFINIYEKKYINKKKREENDLFNQIVTFVKQTNEYKFIKDLSSFFDINEQELIDKIENTQITINPMQEKAVEKLSQLRKDNETKALIIAATGTGKTYLAAFDVLNYNPKRVLFIAHRERILREAKNSFQNIIFDKKMGILTGATKDELNADYLFATNHMASKLVNNPMYDKDYFDYIIIDEAHRVAGDTYRDVLKYFRPKFLLGLTATPERTDASSIFEVFDNNIALEVRLRDALDSQLIVPFHYFGINDIATDISDNDLKDIAKLTKKLNINSRVDLIIENIKIYGNDGKKTKALGFCVSKKHAQYMAESFNRLGLTAVYLTGDDSDEKREQALNRLENDFDPLSYIFTVDIFNEGVDIPSVNLVLMLRPTESPIIFTQQLGRGLRRFKDKEFLTVLDFIGNNKSSFLMAIALSGDKAKDKDDLREAISNDFFDIKGDTFVTLDRKSKEIILNQLENTNLYTLEYFKRIYFEIENRLKSYNKNLLYLSQEDLDLNGFDPTKIIVKYRSYFEFLSVIKNDDYIRGIVDNEENLKLSRFLDGQLPLKQSINYFILKTLISSKHTSLHELFEKVKDQIKVDMNQLEYALEYLSGKYMNENDKYNKYTPFINFTGNIVNLSKELNNALNEPIFNKYFNETIQYGLLRYQREFGSIDNKGLQLYTLYSREEIAYIKQYDKKSSGFATAKGLFEYNNEFFLFVNLNKENVRESIDYKDEFIDNETFQWESPGSTRVNSEVGRKLIYHKDYDIKLNLFIRKNEKEDGITQKFTYFGTLNVKDYENEKPIRFTMKFDHRVPDDIYTRFLVERNVKNEEIN